MQPYRWQHIYHGETEGKGEGESAFLFFSGILGDYPGCQPFRITPPVVPCAVKIQPEDGSRTEAGSRKAHIIAKNGSIFDCTMQAR